MRLSTARKLTVHCASNPQLNDAMKANLTSGQRFGLVLGVSACLLGICLSGPGSALADEVKAPAKPADSSPPAAPDEADLVNWIQFGVGGNFVKGNRAQFQQQKGVQPGIFGGIESFHFETPVDKQGLFSVDGRGMLDNHDYSVKLELSHPDKGYVRFSYTQYREYYDGTGGYLPSNGLSFPGLYDNRLAVDRSHFSLEAGLTLPDKPVVTFRYDYETRTGDKDSTIWGQTLLGPGGSQKKIVPAFRVLDESQHLFALDVKHSLGETDFGLGGRYELQWNQDQRNVIQQPNQGTTSRILTQDEGVKADMFNVHAYTDTKLSEKWEFTTGYSFTTLHSALSGDRLNTPVITPLTAADTRFVNLAGGSDVNQYVLNLNLMCSPNKNWYIVPAVRVEKADTSGASVDNTVTGNSPQVTSATTQFANSDEGALYVTESLDVRYVGITNWAFYARLEFSEDQADLREQFGANVNLPPTLFRDTEWNRLVQKYSLGANWYPTRRANFAVQYYHKLSDNDYHNLRDSTSNVGGDRYPAYFGTQNFDVHDLNFRVTWRPFTLLTLVSRYDFQLNRVYTHQDQLPPVQSGVNERHVFGQTISWTPWNRLYLQAGGNYVLDTTHSPVEDLSGAMSGVILSSPNNYWTLNGTIGFALDNKTDLQLTYSYYEANNYVDNSAVGMPYGSGAKEHEVGAALTRQVSRNLRWTMRYAFSSYRDQTSGGALNYEAQGIQTSIQYRF